MANSKDFEKLWSRYQEEVKTKEKSIVTFCQENGIVYSQFERWYKNRSRLSGRDASLIPVEVVDFPGQESPLQYAAQDSGYAQSDIRSFSVRFGNGLSLRHHDLSYQRLVELVGKMEALC